MANRPTNETYGERCHRGFKKERGDKMRRKQVHPKSYDSIFASNDLIYVGEWNSEEIETLKQMLGDGEIIEDIAYKLMREPSSIRFEMRRLGLNKPDEDEDELTPELLEAQRKRREALREAQKIKEDEDKKRQAEALEREWYLKEGTKAVIEGRYKEWYYENEALVKRQLRNMVERWNLK